MSPLPLVAGGPVVDLPTRHGFFRAQAWTVPDTGAEHLAVTAPAPADPVDPGAGVVRAAPLVRLHSECLTGDVLGSYRCDCGEQLDQALALIQEQGGTVLYLRGHEGRGIGLANKIRAYSLQDDGADTVDANEQLGLPVDTRDYAAAAAILATLGMTSIRLLSNNPLKAAALAAHGITVTELVPAHVPARPENLRYLQTKRDRLNHALSLNEGVLQ